ncbi:hypothetical protein NBRC110019_06530 [Neptunitalea chrysea]|uniref:Phage shock protein C (PspC) family protein n=1 Tax=Neptunitalea chrysea TaxID=1647581 RepID=A0A9W6B5E2_9FLAO|nr:PspC domain-containing protein [Neptunitalea chrysea]GLB51614.1 hypothetical protein NBRC110019_06530 [Neptunitalea chrysea]
MNKTININLGGLFFHIDEEAYFKLQKYLDTIKRSLSSSPGRDEIIGDIEARIAELFSERLMNERQVVSMKDVSEVIDIMGQPEDYMVDEEIFEDEPIRQKSAPKGTHKQLLRDPDNKYIAGVSSGLSYYFGIDPLWIRLLWVLLVIAGFGSPILLYIILWIIMPEAVTTAQKLSMRGEPVNISNIEKKVKEGFEDVADRVKNADYEKAGRKIKSTGQTFFETIGNIIVTILKVFGKFAGVLLIIVAVATLIGLLMGVIAAIIGGSFSVHFGPFGMNESYFLHDVPFWFFMLLVLFAVGIPFFFLLILGIKIIANNTKSIGNVSRYSLLAVWILAIVGLIYVAIEHNFENSISSTNTEKYEYTIGSPKKVTIALSQDRIFSHTYKSNGITIVESDGQEKILNHHVRLNVRPTIDTVMYIKVEKKSTGKNYNQAKSIAENISFNYTINNNLIKLDDYILSDDENKYLNQSVYVTIYVPEDIYVELDPSIKYIISNIKNDKRIYDRDMPDYEWVMGNEELECLNCYSEEEKEEMELDENQKDESNPLFSSTSDSLNLKETEKITTEKIDTKSETTGNQFLEVEKIKSEN